MPGDLLGVLCVKIHLSAKCRMDQGQEGDCSHGEWVENDFNS